MAWGFSSGVWVVTGDGCFVGGNEWGVEVEVMFTGVTIVGAANGVLAGGAHPKSSREVTTSMSIL